jgi:hypothetical protein
VVASRAVDEAGSQTGGRRAWGRASLAAALLGLLLAAPGGSQPLLDLNEMALRWTQGQWGAPLVCDLAGDVRRGVRKILVTPGPRDARPPSNKLAFVPMNLPEKVHCATDTGEPQFEVTGALLFHLDAISRPDIANHEFQETLQREGGFDFTIERGSLKLADRSVDFAKGTARFELVRRGSDASRRLADFDGPKLGLRLEARDGTRLAFDLVQPRPPR